MPRKKTFQVLREAGKVGAYDEMPMLPDDIQIQLHLSRNDRAQPFHLICAKDTLLVLLSGAGTVEFRGTAIERFVLKPGDFVYVPAGAPHRIVPAAESVMLRYKPQHPGLEGIAWYCATCDTEIYREVWDTAKASSQEMYQQISSRFAADSSLRTCRGCGSTRRPPDLTGLRWTEVAREISTQT
jgi:3-hydroxyanthranilate 3,4-dioxygenase